MSVRLASPICGLLVLAVALTACQAAGPTATAAAIPATATRATTLTVTPTAARTATPTPSPTTKAADTATPTETPALYDCTVQVTDREGAPIAGASVELVGRGTQRTDATGKVNWPGLRDPEATFFVSAQGYVMALEVWTLERGTNEIVITLLRDPYGVLPAEACAEGETLLYVEDWQDGQAASWSGIDALDWGWHIGPDPADGANILLQAMGPASEDDLRLYAQLLDHVFADAVWHVRVMLEGEGTSARLHWRHGASARYEVHLSPAETRLGRLEGDQETGGGTAPGLRLDAWHDVAIETMGDTTTVWLDGQQLLSYVDPAPPPPGTIAIETYVAGGARAKVYFDGIVVCGKSAH